jgi:sensor histidine kinase YesM
MIVQPFIENAIKHGLSHKNGEKNLSVIFEEQQDNFLKIIIDDNGIGREHAAELNLARNLSTQSMGIKITSRRLQLIHEKEMHSMIIKDKMNSDGYPSGTEVTILIPLETA